MENNFFRTVILTIGFIMNSFQSSPLAAQNLSHEQHLSSFQEAKQALLDKIQNRGDLPYASVHRQIELLDPLAEFDLGRFLIERGGLNGYWTHYTITHPTCGRLTNFNSHGAPFHPLEAFLLNSAPASLATQQRFSIFKSHIQQHLSEGCSLASVPSGLMADLTVKAQLKKSGFQQIEVHYDKAHIFPTIVAKKQIYRKNMSLHDHYVHAKFGIDEIYVHEGFTHGLLEKLHQRAAVTLDASDNIVLKHASHDMILIFYNQVPNQSLIYRFLKFLDQFGDKENFIESNTLLNEEELFSSIKSKNFVLVTPRILFKSTCV